MLKICKEGDVVYVINEWREIMPMSIERLIRGESDEDSYIIAKGERRNGTVVRMIPLSGVGAFLDLKDAEHYLRTTDNYKNLHEYEVEIGNTSTENDEKYQDWAWLLRFTKDNACRISIEAKDGFLFNISRCNERGWYGRSFLLSFEEIRLVRSPKALVIGYFERAIQEINDKEAQI